MLKSVKEDGTVRARALTFAEATAKQGQLVSPRPLGRAGQ